MTYKITMKVEDYDEEFLASGKDPAMMIDTFNRMRHNMENNIPDCKFTITLYEDDTVSREYHQEGGDKK